MAKLEYKVKVDLTEMKAARRYVKRAMAEMGQANRELARLEERMLDISGRLRELGIRIELEDA